VLATLPFTDLSGSKIRPALVVQCDRNNQRLDDVILAMITRTIHRAATEPTQLLIDLATAEGAATGLLHTSVVKCEHLITLHGSLLTRVIGSMPVTLMQQVDACLKSSRQLK
jgi:mRNA-degrading endonuclease toxin of MazEF toxin-antitoxin module